MKCVVSYFYNNMKVIVALMAVLALTSANSWQPYDPQVAAKDRANIYIDCAFASQYMAKVYHDSYWNNFNAFLSDVIDFLKDNALYVILTPYIKDSTDLAVYEAFWGWLGVTIRDHCCGLDLAYYLVNTVVVTIWARVDIDEFKRLLWANLNRYTTLSNFYWEEFWLTCPFTYWEIYTNYVKPILDN